MRPEPCEVQGCPGLNLVRGGLKNKAAKWGIYSPEYGVCRGALPRDHKSADGVLVQRKRIAN